MKVLTPEQKERMEKTVVYIRTLNEIQELSFQLYDLGLTETEFNNFIKDCPTAVAVDNQLELFYTEGLNVSGITKLQDLKVFKEVLRDLLGTKLAEREIA